MCATSECSSLERCVAGVVFKHKKRKTQRGAMQKKAALADPPRARPWHTGTARGSKRTMKQGWGGGRTRPWHECGACILREWVGWGGASKQALSCKCCAAALDKPALTGQQQQQQQQQQQPPPTQRQTDWHNAREASHSISARARVEGSTVMGGGEGGGSRQ